MWCSELHFALHFSCIRDTVQYIDAVHRLNYTRVRFTFVVCSLKSYLLLVSLNRLLVLTLILYSSLYKSVQFSCV